MKSSMLLLVAGLYLVQSADPDDTYPTAKPKPFGFLGIDIADYCAEFNKTGRLDSFKAIEGDSKKKDCAVKLLHNCTIRNGISLNLVDISYTGICVEGGHRGAYQPVYECIRTNWGFNETEADFEAQEPMPSLVYKLKWTYYVLSNIARMFTECLNK